MGFYTNHTWDIAVTQGAGHHAEDIDALTIREAQWVRRRQHGQVAGRGPLRDKRGVLGRTIYGM